MALIDTSGTAALLVDSPDSAQKKYAAPSQAATELVAWVMKHIEAWENVRNQDNDNLARWQEYWRVWRGVWDPQDVKRKSERSRIITPATAQAVEMTVAEIEEAVFSRERWIDVADSVMNGQERERMAQQVDILLEDLELGKVKDAVAEAVMMAALMGTGIIKVCTDTIQEPRPVRDQVGKLARKDEERVMVYWEAIRPDQFIPDPAGTRVADMLGCAHRLDVPLHTILTKIEQKIYRKEALGQISAATTMRRTYAVDAQERSWTGNADQVEVVDFVEYHGKVPAKLLLALTGTASDDPMLADAYSQEGDGPLIEAIVSIGNGSVLLRAMANPFTMVDRCIVAWAHEKVPGQFWGRGVAEKAINAQRALDTEVRARIDSLAFVAAPMLGVDITKMAKGFKREVYPGKVFATTGPPQEALMPLTIGSLDGNTFNQAAEMERMVQLATGTFDSGVALGRATTSSGGNAATSGSMQMGAFVKRARRAIQNLDRNALQPLIEKTMWRYMQYAPSRYPAQSYRFTVKATLGTVAREIEQLNLTQLMGMLPEGSGPVGIAVAKGIIELSNVQNKPEIIAAMNAAMQPPTPEQQQKAEMAERLTLEIQLEELRQMKAETAKILAEMRELLTQAAVNSQKAQVEVARANIEASKVELMAEENEAFKHQIEISEKNTDLKEKALDHKIKMDARPSS